jgi:hypothetical protein
MNMPTAPRELTYDEKKAAEAAFAGRPFNPKWSDAARTVYEGILKALGKNSRDIVVEEALEPAQPLA